MALLDTLVRTRTLSWIVALGSLALAMLFSALGYQALQQREALWQLQLAKQGEWQGQALSGIQAARREKAQVLAEAIAADAWVVELVRQAHALAALGQGAQVSAREAIRNQLYTRLAPRWRNLQAEHPFRLYVHLAPSLEVLLRVHKPQRFGDGQAAQRPRLRDARGDGQGRAGLGLARGSLGMRAVVPLQVEGAQGVTRVGAIEVAFGVLDDLQRLDRELDAGIALLLHGGELDAHRGGEQLRGLPAAATPWQLLDISQPDAGLWAQRDWLAEPLIEGGPRLIEDGGRSYLVNPLKLVGYGQQAEANIQPQALALTWRDISDLAALHQREERWLIGKWLLAWLAAEALLLLLLFATRRHTQRIMLGHQQALQAKHQQSEWSRQLLTIISQAQAAYLDTQNQGEVFEALLQRILELSASPWGMIGELWLEPKGTPGLRCLALSREGEALACADLQGETGEDDRQIFFRRGPLFEVAGAGRPLLRQAESGALQSLAGLPIRSRGQLIGVLALANRPGGYSPELVEQLEPLLATLGQLLEALQRDLQRDQARWRLQRQQAALRALNEVAALSGLSNQEQLRQALRLGAAFYQLPLGIISRIDGDDYRVQVQVSPEGVLHDGQHFPLGKTYCSITQRSDWVLAIDRVGRSPHAGHPCYRGFALECYIGIVLWVGGQRYGTLNFSAGEPRSRPFDEADHEFLRLFARWVGATLERQQQEQARQALLERLDESQQIARLGHWEANLESGELFWSAGIFDIFGRDAQAFVPSIEAFYQHVHPEDRALMEAAQRDAEAGAELDLVHRIVRSDGQIRWVREMGRLQPDEGGRRTRLVGTVQDISEIKQRELETQQARSFLQALLDSATGVSIIATDPDGLITLFNSGAERLLGYRAEEMVGRCTPAAFHLEDEVRALGEDLSQASGERVEGFQVFVHGPRRGEAETRQWTYLRKDGGRRTVNLTVSAIRGRDGEISGFLGIASDISELQQTTRALQKSESRFRGLVSNLPGVVYRCDNDHHWTMRYLSEGILDLCGYPASELIDNRVRSYASLIHPEDLPSTYQILDAIARREAFEITYRLLHAEGHSVWVREKGRGEFDNQGQLLSINGFIWDISERKAVEDALQISQRRFSSAFGTAPQGMALVSPDGRWLEVNDQLCQMLGYSREELLQRDFQQFSHPDDRRLDRQQIQDLLDGRIGAYQLEKRYLNKQGRTLWALLSVSLVRDGEGRPLHFVAQIQDFSARVAAERLIREREHSLSTLLDNVLDAIITIDQRGRIETFNRAAQQLFGYSLEQVAGRNVRLLMPDAEGAAHDEQLARYRQTGEARLIGKVRELTGRRSDGAPVAIELAMSQISHQGEQRFIAVIRDISARKRIERMKNEFVSTVSHELRTPLTAIAGSLGLINGGVFGEVPAGMRQMLAIAQGNSQRLSELINDLLDMDKLVAGKMRFDSVEQPLLPLIEQAIEQNQPYAEQFQVRFELRERAAARVRVDAQRLLQVLANLLSNAAKFSQPGQVVEIDVQQHDSRVRVSVHDQGCGIPEAFKAQLFGKFSQADASDARPKGGTGLGLAISKEIIERLDGRIGYHSLEGQGATFWFELPLEQPA